MEIVNDQRAFTKRLSQVFYTNCFGGNMKLVSGYLNTQCNEQ